VSSARRFARSSQPANQRFASSLLVSESILAMERGDFKAAQALTEEAIALLKQAHHPVDLGMAHVNQGAAALYAGDYARAESICRVAVAQLRHAKEWQSLSIALLNLGLAQVYQGQIEAPVPRFKESLTIKQRLDDRGGIAEVLTGLAEVARLEHQPERAARLYGAAQVLEEANPGFIPIDVCPGWRQSVASIRAELGDAAFEVARAEGRKMSMDQAIGYAFNSPSDTIEAAAAIHPQAGV